MTPRPCASDLDVRAFKGSNGIVQTYIEQGYPPPGADLAPEERPGLWNRLMTEYADLGTGQGVFIEWLQGAQATSGPATTTKAPN